MVKTLRSFIHEKFPIELRIDLDIISRRRDIKGPEKVEEILNALKKYNVGDITKLGPGTNRYGFKLDGFVVKVATDNDGKIDNMKEFKMAKRLFPHVPKTYEVSENGSLLIAEYIQPFDSFTEMLRYSDEIKTILQDLSSVYLIGDVGITSKNYANWGLRIGTNEVVCLDFAYIYDVSSEIFICRHCKSNSMLVPNKDFTKLICPNPACGKETLFEDIRAMIPNDYHRSQIGDLTEEGYPMTDSNVPTELTEKRSNYLVKKTKKSSNKHTHDENNMSINENVNNYSQDIEINKEDEEMRENKLITNATAVAANYDFSKFRGIVVNAASINGMKVDPVPNEPKAEEVNESEEQGGKVLFSATINTDIKTVQNSVPIEDVGNDKPISSDQPDESQFKKSFIDNSCRAVSSISNRICDELRSENLFDEIKAYIKDSKMYPETFYTTLQNAIFRSLADFLEFTECNIPNNNNNGTHREFRAVEDIVNSESYAALPTLRFIERMFNTKKINSIKDNYEMLNMYYSIFNEHGGIQPEWIDKFVSRLDQKMNIISAGIMITADKIRSKWCVDYEEDVQEEHQNEYDDIETIKPLPDISGSYEINDPSAQENIDDGYEEDEYSEEGEQMYLSVEIFPEDDFDIIRIHSDDAFGNITIPLYANLDDFNPSTYTSKAEFVDERNGVWDWLTHMVPDIMFTTKDPEMYLAINDQQEPDENQIHVVILNVDDNDMYTMGVYMLTGIYIIDDDGNASANFTPDLLASLNALICKDIGSGSVSHLKRSMSMHEIIHDEEYIKSMLVFVDDDEEEVTEESVEEVDESVSDPDISEDSEEIEADVLVNQIEQKFDTTNSNLREYDSEVVDTNDFGVNSHNLSNTVLSAAEAAAIAAIIGNDSDMDIEEEINDKVEESDEIEVNTNSQSTNRARDEKGRFIKVDKETDSTDEAGSLTPVRRTKKR